MVVVVVLVVMMVPPHMMMVMMMVAAHAVMIMVVVMMIDELYGRASPFPNHAFHLQEGGRIRNGLKQFGVGPCFQ